MRKFSSKLEQLFGSGGRAGGRYITTRLTLLESTCSLRSLTPTINSAKVYVYTAFPTATINFATDLILPWFEGFRNKKTKKRQKN